MMMDCHSLLSYVGIITLAVFSVKALIWVARTFVIKSNRLREVAPLKRGVDNWALVTGCTSGIGLGFARELAARQLNIVLVSRDPKKLEKEAQHIEKEYRVKTKTISIDFGNDSSDVVMDKIKSTVEQLPGNVSVLVNNVGVNSEMPSDFLDLDMSEQSSMIKVNIEGTLNVTRAVLPKMCSQKTGGIIINLGSYTAAFPTPMLSVYAGSKAFIEVWSKGLSEEYRSKNITAVAISPMYVVSNMSGFRRPTLTACSEQRIAADSLNSLGTPITPAIYSPYFMHAVLMFVQSLVPERILLGQQRSAMKGVRARYLKKKERAAAGGNDNKKSA